MTLLQVDHVKKYGVGDLERLPDTTTVSWDTKQDADFKLGLKYGYLLAIKDYEETNCHNALGNLFLATIQSFEKRISEIEYKNDREDNWRLEQSEKS